jgi:cytochrome bd ubiquinol oxidase subunit I
MNYPFWDVPGIGGGWVIGIIAIFHIMISHFAVGGGLYLPVAERKALRDDRRIWLGALRGHSRFFLVLTGVFGAVSGVGIWFAIGLANPEATSTLIHNFVFAWGIEWVFFLVELTAAAVYYYSWGRVSDELHLKVGWVYAGASLLTLIIINGILTFMLTPGAEWLAVAGTGAESSRFWQAFLNPTYWPSLALRVTVCISLAGVWALVTTSRIDGDRQPELKSTLVRWTAKWLAPSFLLMPILMGWYVWSVPESQRQLLTLGIATIGSGTFSQVTRIGLVMIMTSATIAGVVYFIAYRSPCDFTLSHALSVLALALVATASGEYARETLRKPYVVGSHMYSNSMRVKSVAHANANGYLNDSLWVKTAGDPSHARGEAMFRGQCGSCHTVDGYRSIRRLLEGRNRESLASLLEVFHAYKPDSPYRNFMPPLAGTAGEIRDLAGYLELMALTQTEPAHALSTE